MHLHPFQFILSLYIYIYIYSDIVHELLLVGRIKEFLVQASHGFLREGDKAIISAGSCGRITIVQVRFKHVQEACYCK